MLETLRKIDWKQVDMEAKHGCDFLHNLYKSYEEVPDFLEELSTGLSNDDFEWAMFGEMDHDFDGKLFELVLPFLWEIVLEAEPEAVNLALEHIDEACLRFYSMEDDGINLDIRDHGISKIPSALLGNNAAAAFEKLKSLIEMAEDPEDFSAPINILSFIPDYHDESIALFQSLLGKGSDTKDEVLLSALGRLLQRYKLPITGDFAKYLAANSLIIQTMAATWIMRLAASPENEQVQKLYDERKQVLMQSFDTNLERWYYIDYQQ